MNQPLGYTGKILWVDLSTKEIREESPEEKIYRFYLGGYGLGVYYVYNHIKPSCDPLGPDNILGFCPGLFTGSAAPMSGRYVVCAKSPLTGKGIRKDGSTGTGGWGNANSGGKFGPAIRRGGFDGIFFKGVSKQPVYLLIHNNSITIEHADEIWGKDCVESEEFLKNKHGKTCEVASIGPAGENLSLVSGIVTDEGRIAARSGLGAVMGSKKLKAVCISGKTQMHYYDKKRMLEMAKAYGKTIQSYVKSKIMNKFIPMLDYITPLSRILNIDMQSAGGSGESLARMTTVGLGGSGLGTTISNVMSSQSGDSPVKNFKGVGHKDFPMKKAMKLRGKRVKSFMKKRYGCFACPVRCGAILEYEGLPYSKKTTHRPEYETTSSFGSLILCDDLDALFKINEFLNRVGMDSISAGNIVAYVMECVEKHILNQQDFKCSKYSEGFLPTWGDSDAVLSLLELIVNREGIGDTLADGTLLASKKIAGTSEFVMHCNGQELPMHDPRYNPSIGLTYITDPTPGRHTAGTMDTEGGLGLNYFIKEIDFENSKDPEEKASLSAKVVQFHQVYEALGICMFAVNFAQYPLLEFIQSATGWEITPSEILNIGHRIQTLRQMFNAREGAIRHEISQRVIGNPPLTKGPTKKVSLDLEIMAQSYYEEMGYAKDGLPLEETLRNLKLDFCIPDLAISEGTAKPLVNQWLEKEGKTAYFGKRYKKE
ncbi:MAG: aldehyde ferredoxin oxidoreductase family protein [Candidatus Lokiarchaeota archaeon]|nr:aldehyde ferredoxin oxidoreductase family protein [Candidatus Lokiarchaeota archaeon]